MEAVQAVVLVAVNRVCLVVLVDMSEKLLNTHWYKVVGVTNSVLLLLHAAHAAAAVLEDVRHGSVVVT